MSIAIAPGSPEHLRMITPSKVAAILGVSRFEFRSGIPGWVPRCRMAPAPEQPTDEPTIEPLLAVDDEAGQ